MKDILSLPLDSQLSALVTSDQSPGFCHVNLVQVKVGLLGLRSLYTALQYSSYLSKSSLNKKDKFSASHTPKIQ